MKFGKKLLATVIVAIMVMALAIVSSSAADYTVKPGGTVRVDLSIYNTEGVQGNISCEGNASEGNASVSYSSQGGGVQGNGDVAIFNDGVKGTITIKVNLTAPSNATPGSTTYTVKFHYRESINNGDDMSDWKTLTRTVEVVSGSTPSKPDKPTPATPEVKVDKTKLQEQINIASDLKKDGYTDDSWNNLLDALTKGQAALSSTKQEDIDTAAKNLQNAIAALVKMDYSQLQAAIEKAKAMGKDNEVNSLWLALLDALSNGDRLLSSGDQAQVDAAAKQINELIEKLLNSDSKSCGIAIHKVWPILFFISLAANVVLVVILVSKKSTKKKNQVDNTPLVDYDINDDE